MSDYEFHTIEVDTIVGPKPVICPASITVEDMTAVHLWKRLLSTVQRANIQQTVRPRSHDAIRRAAEIKMLTLVLADAKGMAPPFWEGAARAALRAEVSQH